ncbi:MAG: acetylornithine deacetylase [Nitriliruptorales bacterium]
MARSSGAADPLENALVLLGDLISFPTLTDDPNLDLISCAEAILVGVGADVSLTYDEGGTRANLFATIGPAADGGVILSGHTDVVPAEEDTWTGSPFVAARRDGRVYGRGAVDMKGFLACALAMAPRFATAELRAPVHVALTFGEEIGCQGAPLLLADLAERGPKPKAAIVGEPTSMRIVHGHKGCYEYTTSVTGLEGHGSRPSQAVNAVEVAVRYIARLLEVGEELAERAPSDSRYEPAGTTISVGTINGGTARNVVPGACSFEWELRPVRRADAEHVRATMTAFEGDLLRGMRARHPEATIATTAAGEVDGLEIRDDSAAVALVRRLLDEPEIAVASFGTEAGLYQQAGIPAVVCGPGSIDLAHRPDEYVSFEQLGRCLDMMERLAAELS